MAKPNVMVKTYKDTGAFQKDAQKLARDGWSVQSSMELTQRTGCGRFLLIGPFALIFHPKPKLTVTYNKSQ